MCRPMFAAVTVTTSSSHPPPKYVPFSGREVPTAIGHGLILLQLNVEGVSEAKLDETITILLQEMNTKGTDVLTILGYSLAKHIIIGIYGIAMFVINSAMWSKIAASPPDCDISGPSQRLRESTSQICTSSWNCLIADSLPCHP